MNGPRTDVISAGVAENGYGLVPGGCVIDGLGTTSSIRTDWAMRISLSFGRFLLLVGILFLGGGCGVFPFSEAKPCCYNPPRINGCGADGAATLTPDILNCFNVSLFGNKPICFETACNLHDACYETVYSHKVLCDLEYLLELNRICQTSGLSVDEFIVCTGRAVLYAAFSGLAGGDAYAKAQVNACRCGDHDEEGTL